MEVRSLMRQAVRYYGDRTAVETADLALTFSQAWDRGTQLANLLRGEFGLRPGDRVASLEDNNLGAVDTFIGCAIAGLTRVPLYARNSREAHAHMVDHTECDLLLVDEKYAGAVLGLEGEVPSLRTIVVRDEAYEKLRADQSAEDPDVPIADDDLYIIRHSGGTTGRPKGVAYTHHDWLVCCRNWFYPLPRLTPSSAVGHAGALSHASGYMFLPAWLHGGKNVIFGDFDPVKVAEMIERSHVTHAFLAPAMLQAITRAPENRDRDWSSVEAILVGSAPITDATALASRKMFGDVLFQLFGQTEALPLTAMDSGEWFGEVPGSTPMRSAGRVLPFARVEIWDEHGKPLPLGSEGEIVAQVEGQMRAYWRDEELTKARVVDGWVRTGDIGKIDANGYVYVLDRADDLIISGGFNIWPAELETVISDHPAVIEVAVFGVPDEKWGETPVARCYVDAARSVTEQEIIDLCVSRLGSYKKPSRVELVAEPLPRSPVGKLQRKLLREPYWAGHDRRVSGV